MATIERTRRERTETAAGLFGGFVAAIGAGLRGLGELRVGAAVVAQPEIVSGATSELFARAVSEGSNRALDWLCYAAQLGDAAERRYCVARALQIDPKDPTVRAEARRLR